MTAHRDHKSKKIRANRASSNSKLLDYFWWSNAININKIFVLLCVLVRVIQWVIAVSTKLWKELLYRTIYLLKESISYQSKKSQCFACYSEVWVWPQRSPGEERRIDEVRHCIKTGSVCWPRFIENLGTYPRLTQCDNSQRRLSNLRFNTQVLRLLRILYWDPHSGSVCRAYGKPHVACRSKWHEAIDLAVTLQIVKKGRRDVW